MRFLLTVLSFLVVVPAFSQPLPPPPPNTQIPLDAVVGLLVVASLVYGVKRLMSSSKKSTLAGLT